MGLGDSFSSGEGNPDRPVVLTSTVAAGDALLPRRPGESVQWAAHWIDRACHRSIYSWQFRSAIQQTLINPENPITFMSFACSGAEVIEGLLFPWSGPEQTPNTTYQSQLASIYEELCRTDTNIDVGSIPKSETDKFLDDVDAFPWSANENRLATAAMGKLKCQAGTNSSFVRPLNSILLSIGGNDLGFARWIAAAITDGLIDTGFIPRLSSCNVSSDAQDECDLTNARIARLKSRLSVLRRVLVDRVMKDGGMHPSKLLMISYPKATNGLTGNTCPNGNEGMTVSVGLSVYNKAFAIRDNAELTTIEWFRANQLVPIVRSFAEPPGKPFTFIDSFVDDFAKHGFCATANADEASGRDLEGSDLFYAALLNDAEIRESLHLPRVGAALRRGDRVVSESKWRPFSPDKWKAYSTRSRWLRTPNDVFLTVNNKPSALEEGNIVGILDMRNRGSSGAFHPTAEGHAAIARKVSPFLLEALK